MTKPADPATVVGTEAKMHICMEEVLAIMACIPGLTLATYKLKAWWHTKHFKKHHKPFQPKDCPHDHTEC